MSSYTTYWPFDWVKTIINNGDTGPLSVIYGGEHRSQPPLGKETIGDTVFPVTLSEGCLFVLGRLTIQNIMSADDYIDEKVRLIRKPFMWDSYTAQHKDTITHQVPRTCADKSAVGIGGTTIALRPIPVDKVRQIQLGPVPGKEQPMKMRNANISVNNFSGYFRRLSEESAEILNFVVENK